MFSGRCFSPQSSGVSFHSPNEINPSFCVSLFLTFTVRHHTPLVQYPMVNLPARPCLFFCLNSFISINAVSVLIICEWTAEGKKAEGGSSSATSSFGPASEPGIARPPHEVIQNNRVTNSKHGITDAGNCICRRSAERTLVLSLEAFIFSSYGLF